PSPVRVGAVERLPRSVDLDAAPRLPHPMVREIEALAVARDVRDPNVRVERDAGREAGRRIHAHDVRSTRARAPAQRRGPVGFDEPDAPFVDPEAVEGRRAKPLSLDASEKSHEPPE